MSPQSQHEGVLVDEEVAGNGLDWGASPRYFPYFSL